MTIRDENVEAVREARESQLKFGGLDGWFRHLQARDRQRAAQGRAASGKRSTDSTRKRRPRAIT
jgi:hypothetical protein